MKDHSHSERIRVINEYSTWLPDQLKNKDSPQYYAIHNIVTKLTFGHHVELLCYCHPKPCHALIIKKCIEDELNNM